MTLPGHLVKFDATVTKIRAASIVACPRLILLAAQHLSGFRIDQVHPRAGDACKRRQKGFSIGLSLDSRA
jgi:hypothetical protein